MTPTRNNVEPTTSATEELSRMLDERGKEHRVWPSGLVIWHDEGSWVYEYSPPKGDDDYWGGTLRATLRHCTPEQAVEATLGETPTPPPPTPPKQPPYDELIESLRRDWDIEASWDGLRRFWYVGLTDEGVRKRDEREATLGRGTCHNAAPSYLDFLCSECGFVHYHSDENDSGDGNEWHYCPSCGAEVVDA